MRKYQGKYPGRIKTVSSNGKGVAIVYTNDGRRYEIKAKDTKGIMPKPGQEITDFD